MSNKDFRFEDRITTVSFLSLGLFVGVRGFYWTVRQDAVLGESAFYSALHEVMPIWFWGILLLVFGAFLILASFFYGRMSVNKLSLYFVLIGGTGSAIIHFLMASAALYNAINWLTPAQFVIVTGLLGFAGFMAGVELYARR